MQDIKLEKNSDNIYDISIVDGDFESVDGFDTAILMSLFIDKRANQAEVSESSLRRGWIGNEQNDDEDYEVGSKLWLLDQARLNQDSVNRAIDFTRDGFIWMIEDSQVKDVQVTGQEFHPTNISVTVSFVRFDNTTFNKQFNLWENTDLV